MLRFNISICSHLDITHKTNLIQSITLISHPPPLCMRSLWILVSVLLSCALIYLPNYALFCPAAQTNRGATRILVFGDPQIEGNHRIQREGWRGEFSVALDQKYLSHVVCNALRHFAPTHVIIVGARSVLFFFLCVSITFVFILFYRRLDFLSASR